MTINLNNLTVMNNKRQVKRYKTRHAFNTGLIVVFIRVYERLQKEGK